MDTKATPLSSPADWIAERRRVADDAIVAYMCHYAAASTATVCGIAADDAWDRAQAVFDTAVTAIHAAHPYTIAGQLGATTATDYLQENAMPIAPTPPMPWFRIWSPDCTTAIWESRGANELDAAKQFMAGHGIDDAPMTIDYGANWRTRWSGRIFRPSRDTDYQIHDANAYLRHLTNWPNPAVAEIRPRAWTRTVAVVAYTRARAEEIADALGIDKRWAFGAKMADAFDGMHVDRVLIDAHSTELIGQPFMEVIRCNVVKSKGSISYITVRDAS
ncbi:MULTISPECIES: hypothetical protein [Mycolicibacterium]|jgi:hypothetical protein|uniref:Uncharacterized protein n=3 Tax=Mycolicibacterium TaxID=1866885 RepID=A0AAE5AG91_MYCFO|nr:MULTISPECIES: hypothetical protein [Mycolicibacterium]KLI04526.1 hypothetical protein AA982_29510 [Mycolicibacterium senegalense]KLO53830.1 hypothetical protein ABW05_22420 [Mycolicibacterium senegalense]KMV16358.1 hypothetical protein ACT17_20545 [Mycolicibacterium conceptionense]MDV7194311.1 hypothetical protein [Mycolicibacterium fortuitum]MDV7294270.1 hypothetical protein [Mycolicibacterium fortuitum]